MSGSEGSVARYEYALPITQSGVVRLVPRLRERFFTEGTENTEAIVQAQGDYLAIHVWSDRDDVVIRLPFEGVRFERPYTRSLRGWGVNVNRWTTPGKHDDPDEKAGWHNDARLEIAYGGASAREMIQATVGPLEGARPDV